MDQHTGKLIIGAGAIIIIIGLLVYFFHDKLEWVGHLPGDVRIEKENFRFYFPVVTMIVFSVLLSVVAGILKRIF